MQPLTDSDESTNGIAHRPGNSSCGPTGQEDNQMD